MTARLVKGFDHQAQQPLAFKRSQWRDRLSAVLAAGGSYRNEHGETFAHGPDGRLLFECAAKISLVARRRA